MRIIEADIPLKVLTYLAHRYADLDEATRPKATEIAQQRFRAACETTHAWGVGSTPAAVYQAVMTAYKAEGKRPRGDRVTAHERGEWAADVADRVCDQEIM